MKKNLARVALVVFAVASVGCREQEIYACRRMCDPAPVDRYENGSCYCAKANAEPRDAGVKK